MNCLSLPFTFASLCGRASFFPPSLPCLSTFNSLKRGSISPSLIQQAWKGLSRIVCHSFRISYYAPYVSCVNLVRRGCDPFGQHQGSLTTGRIRKKKISDWSITTCSSHANYFANQKTVSLLICFLVCVYTSSSNLTRLETFFQNGQISV